MLLFGPTVQGGQLRSASGFIAIVEKLSIETDIRLVDAARVGAALVLLLLLQLLLLFGHELVGALARTIRLAVERRQNWPAENGIRAAEAALAGSRARQPTRRLHRMMLSGCGERAQVAFDQLVAFLAGAAEQGAKTVDAIGRLPVLRVAFGLARARARALGSALGSGSASASSRAWNCGFIKGQRILLELAALAWTNWLPVRRLRAFVDDDELLARERNSTLAAAQILQVPNWVCSCNN